MQRKTTVSIEGDAFVVNGRVTYAGRTYKGMTVEGLLPNSRMVQGIFDDLNPKTRHHWAYPDGPWDAERNTREFVAAMSEWKRCGLTAFTINLQGGSPEGYSKSQPWYNSAFEADGALRGEYLRRLERILDEADRLSMVAIVGLFYFGQDERLADEAAVIRATENATDWLIAKGYTNVLVEVCNETDVPLYEHAILRPQRVDELVRRIRRRSKGKVNSRVGRLLVSVSTGGGTIPPPNVIAAVDFVLLHANGVSEPARIRKMVDRTRAMAEYRGQPVLFNEDDHYDFDAADNNFLAALSRHASWGFFDFRRPGEGLEEGYQSVPCDWRIGSARKRGFFRLLTEITGAGGS